MTKITKAKIRSAYEPHERVQFSSELPSRTKQAPHAECDINVIMSKYEKTGVINHFNTHQGDYGDFLGFSDFHDAMNQVRAAEDAFASIPSRIRKEFNNDPAQFMEFAQNPSNLDKMREMGLAKDLPPTPLEAAIEASEDQEVLDNAE